MSVATYTGSMYLTYLCTYYTYRCRGTRSQETYQESGEGYKKQDKRPSRKDIAQRTYQNHAASITCLHERSDRRGLFEADMEGIGHPVENRLVVCCFVSSAGLRDEGVVKTDSRDCQPSLSSPVQSQYMIGFGLVVTRYKRLD